MNKINASDFKGMLRSACANLQNNAKHIDTLNVFPVPDGDTGTNMSMTFNSGYQDAIKCSSESVSDIAKAFSKGLLMGARGNSGVITSQIFRGLYQYIEGKDEIDVNDISGAFENGARVAYKAIMKPVEGTILTVIRESSWYANHDYESEHFEIEEYFNRLSKYAYESLQRTPDYLPVLKEVGVVDSGGTGLLKIIEGMKGYINGNPIDFDEKKQEVGVNPALMLGNDDFGYCTEFIFRLDDNTLNKFDEKAFKKKINDMNTDSLVVVRDEELVKVHVHTLKPGDILNLAQRYGEFVKLKIENMKEQHSSIIANAANNNEVKTNKERKRYGIITVAAGNGITDLFKQLGADIVITGGQTMNPSTQDFCKAIDELNYCDDIIILPNNSNIILAANQAKNIAEDNNIYVIETKSIQAGLSALTYFDPDSDVDVNCETLNSVIKNIVCASVTYAIKDTSFEGIDVKQGDYIGILNKSIVSSNDDIKIVVSLILDEIVKYKDKELLTLITGEGSDEELTKYIEDYINQNSSIEVNTIEGNQPVYSYLFGLE